MVCPHCKKNSITFFKVYLLGWFRTFTCPECGKKSKQKIPKILFYFFMCLCFVAGYFFKITWGILVLVVVLIIYAVVQYKFSKLMPVD